MTLSLSGGQDVFCGIRHLIYRLAVVTASHSIQYSSVKYHRMKIQVYWLLYIRHGNLVT